MCIRDSDDTDPDSTVRATDADCDGVLTADDCDDTDPDSTTVAMDFDCDGTPSPDDCDDTDPDSTTFVTDADCDGTLPADDCDDTDPDSTVRATDANCDGVLTVDDCDDTDPDSTTVAMDFDCDGTPSPDDCDDTDAGSTTLATDADCDGIITSDDCVDDDPSVGVDCPILSCKDLHDEDSSLASGIYELTVPGSPPFEAYCDMEAGGWTLVYLASVSAGYSSPDMIAGPGDLGETALAPEEEGHWKLDDDKINTLRSGGVDNDIRVSAYVSGSLVGHSWHKSSCHITWSTGTTDGDCLLSTRSGASATDYTTSGHAGAITRWYVDSSFGYILPHTHLGPIAGGTSHGGSTPNPYCTFYDARACPQPSKFHVWIY